MSLQISKITTTKNLLAFSGGVDSTALFFTLLENTIPFDIAIVNYNLREQSKEEVSFAKELAEKYSKKIFIKEVICESSSNFEKNARDIRYYFFDEVIKENNYEALITAHQLNDKFEWFLMQFSKGAGLNELLSFDEISLKNEYKILKPMLNISRKEIYTYLKQNSIKYFEDESNINEKFRRNYFRKNYSNSFLEEFDEGVKRSFEYLENDKNSLFLPKKIFEEKELEVFEALEDDNLNIKVIDKSLKKRGYLISKASRDEILSQKQCVISHKISISITPKFIYIAPYLNEVMPKEFKEKCRVKKLPKNIRAYIFKENLLEKLVF